MLASALPVTAVSAQSSPSTSASTPTLVVFITVDQMRPDYLDRFGRQFTGGFARLVHGGAVFTDAFQDHAITVTAQGHAATMSGRFPRSTGIMSDDLGSPDPQAPLIGGAGVGAVKGSSPFRFRGSTLIDWLRIKDIRARALSVSRKDRGAIMPLGRAHQEVYWYAYDGRFSTSTYYHDTLPSWINRFNARRMPQRLAGQAWIPVLPDSMYHEPDSVRAEANGKNFVFPHVLPTDTTAAERAIVDFPWMDQITLDLALDGLTELKLGTGPQTDILAVSLSTTDGIGHKYGPDSKEMHDQVIRLDRSLGTFFDSLYKLRDSTHVVIALTADHGSAPLPGVHSADPNQRGRFLDPQTLIAPEQRALVARGLPDSTIQFADGLVLLQRGVLARAGINPDSIVRAMELRLRAVPGIARVETRAELARRDTTTDYIARRWAHMIPPDLDDIALMVTADPYIVLTNGSYDTHGTPYDYDAHVPMIFYGPPFRTGRYNQFARVVDMAPTLAWVTGANPTERLDGRVLWNALRTNLMPVKVVRERLH
ncbi:MAG: alkaline phosphatase family protein [Gemmatimonadaceae bacterium]